MRTGEQILRDRVVHLILDFRMSWVEQQLKLLRVQLSKISGDVERMTQTVGEIKRMQEIRNLLAKKLGNDIVV